jgi:glycine cleavage system H protein
VFVELPFVVDEIAQRDPCAVVESVKAASDIYAPVSGLVVAINEDLDSDPALINALNQGLLKGPGILKIRTY